MWITKADNLIMVKELKKELSELNARSKYLLKKVARHRIQLGYMIEDSNKRDAGIVKTEHEHLEEELGNFVKLFRKNRKDVFRITEYVIDSEKLAIVMDT